jgi:hypothetical protein
MNFVKRICSPALRDTSDAKSLASSPIDFAVSAAWLLAAEAGL